MVIIGRINHLKVLKASAQGVILDGEHLGEVRLPAKQAPSGIRPGQTLDAFVYMSSEGYPEATTRKPIAQLGDVAWLRVVSITSAGAFLDWGAPRDLLLPKREQLPDIAEGEHCMVKIFLDEQQRITASEHLNDFLDETSTDYKEGQKVALVISEGTELGIKVIVNDSHWGLLYHDEIFTPLSVGMRVDGYIKKLRADHKLDVTLNQAGYGKVEGAAGMVLELLDEHDGFMPFSDKSTPEEIYSVFGMSKKVFKQAIGSLFKQKLITIEKSGIKRVR